MFIIFIILALAASTFGANPPDPYDLSFFRKGAAIGDSYAAGIGAGNQVDYDCSRYDGSYANLVSLQLDVEPSDLDFTYTACSGAVISGVNDQATALSDGQQFIIMSAGGNDADLVGILNSCVYSYWGGLSHPACETKLNESQSIINSPKFASDLDGLIGNAKSKLASGGNIYYVGYAKFFDVTDNGCDSVSWHLFINLFTREFLTQDRRQKMNDLVDLMNSALQAAVQRAEPQVHFINYDNLVGATNGRYCQPGQDETGGNSANRQELFFYEMKSNDSPWLLHDGGDPSSDGLKRRQNTFNDDGDYQPVNNTLNALYGALIQEAIETATDTVIIENDNANADLDAEVVADGGNVARSNRREAKQDSQLATSNTRSARPAGFLKASTTGNLTNSTRTGNATHSSETTLLGTQAQTTGSLGRLSQFSHSTKRGSPIHSSSIMKHSVVLSNATRKFSHSTGTGSPIGFPSSTRTLGVLSNSTRTGNLTHFHNVVSSGNSTLHKVALLSNNSATNATSSRGTIIANGTHVFLANGKAVEKFNLKKLFVSDMTSRVFHPTQAGHALVANVILYEMVVANAKSWGITVPAMFVNNSGDPWPQVGGAACTATSSDTYTDRNAMKNAVSSFCADPRNLQAREDEAVLITANPNSLDYMSISIQWGLNASGLNIGEHSCLAWLDTLTDGCSVPPPGATNDWKHGGSISYTPNNQNVTLTIEPRVVRTIWDGGQNGQGNAQCSDPGNNQYLAQATLAANVADFCAQSAAQPNGVAQPGSVFSQTYNDGTPDRVVLSTEWPLGTRNFQIFQDECSWYMSVLSNGCSFPDQTNPMNWKHGGSISDNNAVKYTISPTQNRPPPPISPQGHCHAEYRFWGYTWDVWGGGFGSSDGGDELHRQIKGCGAITAWKFEYLPIPGLDGTEWHASGTLPLTISSHCLAKAVKSAGGYDSNC